MGLLTAGAGCVVPIPASVDDGDGGPNAPPVIAHPVPDMPYEAAGPARVADTPTVTFDVKDIDLQDHIYARIFRDYQLGGLYLPNIDEKEVVIDPSSGDNVRQFEFDTGAWCFGLPSGTTDVVFDVVVSDRPFLANSIEPVYRATTGEVTIRSWVMSCQ